MKKTIHLKDMALKGDIKVPGDKSMSHRAVIFGALSTGKTVIHDFLSGEDCLRTIKAFQQMGVDVHQDGQTVTIDSKGAHYFTEPHDTIHFGNSGTTARLLLGVLAGRPFHSVLTGDDSLSKRPMDRVTMPIQQMGARTDGRSNGRQLPMSIRGGTLSPIEYELPVNSAQVKSAVLLAGLFANGITTVIEPIPTRDHTERMIKAFGGKIDRLNHRISINGHQSLQGTELSIPGDISSASFYIAGTLLAEHSDITIAEVGLNPTRTGIIDVLEEMGADIQVETTKYIGDEPVGSIHVQSSNLKGITISGNMIPRVIDEIPLLALLATQAEGETLIKDAKELRFKETDRIKTIVQVLNTLGANVIELEDGMKIKGRAKLQGGTVSSYGDHRIGMMEAIASLITNEAVEIENPNCISISYPNFFEDLQNLSRPL
ncbi:3-phosphoshikimate 1-carboxyvinyltransferase [Salinibacillus kushneri]|uniref:3-phosphoshikimate 1-carboxyvinyltransferase n=1 Tax=Salinibacillus kushneri TaxID=237682 RepID=A0A1I0I1L1_9BACI|nr:3-phosphoshikimate 1-carboxyvinyltransferase [Salinibacillus kushneri]